MRGSSSQVITPESVREMAVGMGHFQLVKKKERMHLIFGSFAQNVCYSECN